MSAIANTGFGLSLRGAPPIYIFPTFLDIDGLHEFEEQILALGGALTYDPKEARIFLGRILKDKRAAFELRSKGIWTRQLDSEPQEPLTKRMRFDTPIEQEAALQRSTSETLPETETISQSSGHEEAFVNSSSPIPVPEVEPVVNLFPDLGERVLVLKIVWLEDSIKNGRLLPFAPYLVYDAEITARPENATSPPSVSTTRMQTRTPGLSRTETRTMPPNPSGGTLGTILARAEAEAPADSEKGHQSLYQQRRRFNQRPSPSLPHPNKPPRLHRASTSEFEKLDAESLPEPPDWVRDNIMYSCLRSTPLHSPNARFISELLKIKEARILTLDEIGVRAYSTSIASIAAYPYLLKSPAEVLRLPGCEQKMASLFAEFYESAEAEDERYLPTARDLEQDEDLQHLKLFYEIWGVGADTARKLYFDRGWKDLDDIVEFGWTTLNRVQQIGVKFYDEFQIKIPRQEVELIRDIVLQHARSCCGIPRHEWGGNGDIEAIIVGGYRRGKEESGDVDIILSHRDPTVTENLVLDVVGSLEQEGWITHTLTLNTTSSDRGQQTLPFRTGGGGHGFDSLDKALCVWQDPNLAGEGTKPNIHRRVDIIVSAWRTVGCAILGWSGGTTFQRDIRRYVKRSKAWKFDSSGVRDRARGVVVDLESPRAGDEGDTWQERERRLMEGLGIGWRGPEERCTG